MADPTEPPAAPRRVRSERGRRAGAASFLVVLLLGGYFATSGGQLGLPSRSYLIHAVVMVMAFWFPATRTGSLRELLRSWLPLGAWLLAWTLVWDLATSGLVGQRAVFQEWWVVYPAGVGFLAALLLLHAAIADRVGAQPERSV